MIKFFIKSILPAIVYIDNDYVFKCTDVYSECSLDNSKDHFFSVRPLDLKNREYHFILKKGAEHYELNDLFGELLNWGNKAYTLTLNDIKARHFGYSEAVSNQKASCFGKENSFLVVKDNFNQLLIDDTEYITRHILPDGIKDIRMKCETIAETAIFALSGAVRNKPYLLIAVREKSTSWQIKIDTVAEKIEQTPVQTLILTDNLDIAGRAKVEVYANSNFEKTDEYFVYTAGTVKRPSDIKDLPIACFQAIKATDSVDTLSCLTAGLKTTVTFEDLSSFLGQYRSIIPNIFLPEYPDTFGLVDSDNKVVLFRFEFLDNLIDNISEIEYT